MNENNIENWISVRDASKEFGYATEYIRQLIRDGEIDAEKKGFSYLVNRNSLREYKDKKTQVN